MAWLARTMDAVAPSEKAVMLFFCFANLFNYLDRGIIPGASSEIDAFIQGTHELEGTESADVFLGLLQSSYIFGYSAASILFGSLIHSHPPFRLVGYGLLVWCAAAVLAGFSRGAESFTMLLLARMLSGVGEASFQVVAAPYIQDHAGEAQGAWLGLYYTAIPLGTALGYVYGASFAHSALTWAGAFVFEAFLMAPLALFCFVIPDSTGGQRGAPEAMAVAEDVATPAPVRVAEPTPQQPLIPAGNAAPAAAAPAGEPGIADEFDAVPRQGAIQVDGAAPPASMSGWGEAMLILKIRTFWLVALGYAGYAATIMGFATFGPAFVMGLGFFDDEQDASFAFGALVSVAGIVGTPLGGWLLDKGKQRISAQENAFYAAPAAPGEGRVRTSRVPLSVRSMALVQVLGLILIGAVFNFCVVPITNKGLFLFLMGVGITFLMAPTAGMNLSVLESVPHENRSLAIGLATLIMHAFGDVPSPIVIGGVKGALAPHCTPRGEDAAIPAECADEQDGLRATLYLLSAWIIWALIGFGAALHASRGNDVEVAILRQLEANGANDPEDGAPGEDAFGGPRFATSRTSFNMAQTDERVASPGHDALDTPLLTSGAAEA